jgi:uncharacterized protein (DUF924 family)
MKTQVYHFYTDSGHGWLKVPREKLEELNLIDQISKYSYQNGSYVYLEEDCDAYTFIRAMEEKGIKIQFQEHFTNGDSSIRYYDRFKK